MRGAMLPPPQGEDRGKGDTDGICQNKTIFPCAKDCGVFADFSRVRPVAPSSLSTSSRKHSETDEVAPGDRVTYFVEDKCQHGMVLHVKEKDGEHCVRISTVSNPSVYCQVAKIQSTKTKKKA